MTRLFLMRHGNTFESTETPLQIGARTDLPLTEYGKEQALKMANYLKEHSILPQGIYASRLQRQMQTAQIIAANCKVPWIEEGALAEIDYGLWEGLRAEEVQRQWPQEYEAWIKQGLWQKKIFASQYEMHQKQWHTWLATLPEGDIVAISSNGLIRTMLNGEKVQTGHFCELQCLDGHWNIKSWNQNPRVLGAV